MIKNNSFLILVLPLFLLTACSRPDQIATKDEELLVGPSGYTAIETNKSSSALNDKLRKKIGSVFLVEQFNAKIFESMKTAIQNHPPGGIVFWNPEEATATDIFKVNSEYSLQAEKNGLLPLLLSTDYEGGALKQSLTGKSIIGIQRFTKGFSKLAHPSWLGRAINQTGNARLCYLHGALIAKEMKMSGFNYPLATVSDLAQNLFANRGISKDSNQISICLKEITKAFIDEKNIIFVTKHFPGLGETRGDTHEQTVVSKASNISELNNSIKPFNDLIQFTNSQNAVASYSILASHGRFDVLDNQNITTVSKKILTDYLRKSLSYRGITVSDAMWMGEYGHLTIDKLLVIYLRSLLAGMDLQMISGKTFAPAVKFFRDIYDDTLTDNDKASLARELDIDWNTLRQKFIERLIESTDRIENIKRTLIHAHKTQSIENYVQPKDATIELRKEYYLGLERLGLNIQE